MTTATQPTDLADLRNALIQAVREATGVSATNTIADRHLNTALHDLVVNLDFPWGRRRTTLLTAKPYTTGTISVTSGGTSVTGDGTLWNTAASAPATGATNARVGGKMILGSVTEGVYEVQTLTNDTTMVVTPRYTGTAALSGSDYTYFEDEYTLVSDFFRSANPRQFSDDMKISIIPLQEFRARYSRNHIRGAPTVATIFDAAFSGNSTRIQRIQFHPAPDKTYQIPYEYITTNLAVSSTGTAQAQLVATTDEPIIPLRYRHLLVLGALVDWFAFRKDDSQRAQEANAKYVDLVRRIASDVGVETPRPRLAPRTAQYFGRRVPRGRRYDVNGEFDQMLK